MMPKLEKMQIMFFDRKGVIAAAGEAAAAALSKFGAFVMTTARGLLRDTKKKQADLLARTDLTDKQRARRQATIDKPAAPGKPPKSRTGLLKNLILFAFEPHSRSVVIGPAKLNQKIGNAPEALEYGGSSQTRVGRRGQRRIVNVQIHEHPYMRPAFAKNQKKLPRLFAGSAKVGV